MQRIVLVLLAMAMLGGCGATDTGIGNFSRPFRKGVVLVNPETGEEVTCSYPYWAGMGSGVFGANREQNGCIFNYMNQGYIRKEEMKGKEDQLKDKGDPSSGGEPTISVEQKEGPIVIDKGAKVHVGIFGSSSSFSTLPAYRYFHKKDCKHLWSVSAEEMTAGEAIARGKSMCPDCFR